MAEQETKATATEPVWTKVEGKNLEKAKVGVIRMSPNVEQEIQEKYKLHMVEMRDGKIKGENGKPPMVTWEHGEHVYGLTYFTDNDNFSIWRRPKNSGGSGGGGKKPYLRLTGFTVGDENKLNAFLTEHQNGDYFLEPITFPDVSSGIQQFVISSKKLVWPSEEKKEDKQEENKSE